MTRRADIAAFFANLLALYTAAVVVAELAVGRRGSETAFQRLWAARGQQVDWLVLGASHALPLAYGEVPARLHQDTGQTMLIAADIGAGPLYNLFVARQAMKDVTPAHVLYVLDTFAFRSEAWNTARVADRGQLRRTPLRAATLQSLAELTLSDGVDPHALADYATGFSKLNPPELFPQSGWKGAADFDKSWRPSRHSVQSRVEYLYPDGTDARQASRNMDRFEALVTEVRAAGAEITVARFPMPDPFLAALPDESDLISEFDRRLRRLGLKFIDLSNALPEPALYFDSDHLNRDGVDALYGGYLREILTPGAR